ncbi:dsDNA nuclease domain-containing protein [Streptomyces sp. NPDC002586]
MQADGSRQGVPATVSPGIREAAEVFDAEQLRRITSTHRGFAYQHLYAVGCLLRGREAAARLLRVERDEDIEVAFDDRHLYLQVKTRQSSVTWGDVRGAVEHFARIREEHRAGRRAGTPRLVVVTNAELGPGLLAKTGHACWPADVALVGPGRPHPHETWLPPPGRDLAAMLKECTELAGRVPFGSLSAATLVWKLAAQVQYACTGAHGHEFSIEELPGLCEQIGE